MTTEFYKYQGTGNDFIIIDNRSLLFDKTNFKNIAKLCDRRFGIGADGLILLENHSSVDFTMVYYNADGNESSMCGNGGRCITAFAKFLGIIETKTTFEAIDGMHEAEVNDGIVSLKMQNVETIENYTSHVFLNTGSPHHIQLEDKLSELDVKRLGRKLRYAHPYNESGSNINFVSKISDNKIAIRTYERGVEDETLSCGTGATAAALAMHYIGATNQSDITLKTNGGELQVSFKKTDKGYEDIWLKGPAIQVFKGDI